MDIQPIAAQHLSAAVPSQFNHPQLAGTSLTSNSQTVVPSFALRGISDSFGYVAKPSVMKESAENVAMWGGREWLGKTIDKATAPVTQQIQKLKMSGYDLPVSQLNSVSTPFKTYSELLHLPTDAKNNIVFKDVMSPSSYRSKVQGNFSDLYKRSKLKAQSNRGFLPDGFTRQDFLKGTVVESNIKPVKDLLRGENIGSGLARMAGFSFMGFDIFKTAKATYQFEKENADGTLMSQAKVLGQTAKAAVLQSAKNLVSWEVAGVGMAVGSKLLPGFTSVPLGGVVLGVAAATTAKKGLDKIMPTEVKPKGIDLQA